MPVHFGGPVEAAAASSCIRRIIVGTQLWTLNGIALTATVDILKSIARGSGSRQSLLALGYAGWGPGQLDEWTGQMAGFGARRHGVFDTDLETKWERAIFKLGIDPRMLSGEAGHAYP